ncbi:MAG: hypothetical protein A2X61_13165 [Ignavibacteria bacterium GWB2_35_12]|nr:MAG: hypothetical protein A2X61_13165 [Ignavibacteria bacterium GWB2_35_12]OGV19413.1 MAG: hypothetical protein A2475_04925 [Ignavibacteria bacterium RIFOXYC2_FULL_35_21]
MMLKSITLIFFFVLAITHYSQSQIKADTSRGEVGDEILINIIIPDSITATGINSLNGKILITNPTVFYPDSISNASDYFLIKDDVFNNNDNVWNFEIEFEKGLDSSGEINIHLYGEALAGTDSICILKFRNVKLNDIDINDFDAVVITHTSGTPLPYIRFAKLVNYYSNNEESFPSIWHYLIDKPSIVEFYLIDVRGKETFLVNLGEQSEGIHEYIFTLEMGFSSGLYLMKLKTNTGESVVPFIISK